MAEFSAGFRLFADSSQFQGELAKAARAAEGVSRGITKAFQARNIGRTLATALGLNLNTIAGKLVDGYKEAAELADRLASFTQRAADATERLLRLRQDDNTILSQMEKTARRIGQELENALNEKPRQSWFAGLVQRGSALDKIFGLSRGEDNRREELVAQKTAEQAEQAAAIEAKRLEMRKKADDEAYKAALADTQEQRKKAEVVADLAAFEREQRRAKMTDEQLAIDLERERRSIAKQIAEYEKFGLEHLSSGATEELLDLKKQQAEVQERIAALTEKTAKAEKETTKQAEKSLAVITSIMGVRTSRQFGDASDEALRAAIAKNEQAIFSMGPIRNIGQDFEVARLQAEIGNLRQELDFRSNLRRDVQMFGVEGARRNFQGDPLAFDRLVQQLVQDGRDQKTITAQSNEFLRQLVENQRNPKTATPVVVVGG